MSIILQNASASFVQVTPPDERYHLVVSATLVGHSELQDRLIRLVAGSSSLRSSVSVDLSGGEPQLRVHLSADEEEVRRLLNPSVPEAEVAAAEEVQTGQGESTDGTAQTSSAPATDPADKE